jgi:hypothetical protein
MRLACAFLASIVLAAVACAKAPPPPLTASDAGPDADAMISDEPLTLPPPRQVVAPGEPDATASPGAQAWPADAGAPRASAPRKARSLLAVLSAPEGGAGAVADLLSAPAPRPHYDETNQASIAATLKRCAAFKAALTRGASCSELAQLVASIAGPFASIANHKPMRPADEDALQACMDRAADVRDKTCGEDPEYKRALARLLAAAFR